jgi:anti-anti-sigma regulatory factor
MDQREREDTGDRHALPRRLDVTGAADLRAWFLERRDPAVLDAAAVEVVTTSGLQVLLSAREHMRALGVSLTLHAPSDAFLSCLATLGCDPGRLIWKGPA